MMILLKCFSLQRFGVKEKGKLAIHEEGVRVLYLLVLRHRIGYQARYGHQFAAI